MPQSYVRISSASPLLFLFTPAVLAASAGTDVNLRHHIVSAGMAGAAYTRPQEPSAAIAGNPATLRQFNKVQYNFGASIFPINELKNTQQTEITTLDTTFVNESVSAAGDYVLPTFGGIVAATERWTWGVGLEVDAGIGADFRNNPITLLGGAGPALGLGSTVSLPLTVELVSLNANVGAAYQLTPDLSVGASLTVGFGLMQLGTVGNTTGLTALNAAILGATGADFGLADFGGTTADVHDTAIAGSIGLVWDASDTVSLSATYKSKLNYGFEDVITSEFAGFENLNVDQPSEWIAGIAFTDVLVKGSLIEFDVIYKDWEDSDTYQDLYENQMLWSLGVQFTDVGIKGLDLRFGYSYMDNPLLDVPNNTINGLSGAGTIPLGQTAEAAGLNGLAIDVVRIVQMTFVPVIWEQTLTTGLSYQLTDGVILDTYLSYSFSEEDSRSLETIDGLLGAFGLQAHSTSVAEVESELLGGVGIRVLF